MMLEVNPQNQTHAHSPWRVLKIYCSFIHSASLVAHRNDGAKMDVRGQLGWMPSGQELFLNVSALGLCMLDHRQCTSQPSAMIVFDRARGSLPCLGNLFFIVFSLESILAPLAP